MKRKIEDYKHKEVAIKINSIEEFDKIKALLGWSNPQKGATSLVNANFNTRNYYVSCYSDDWSGDNYYQKRGFLMLDVSDFLEEHILEQCKKKYPVGTKFKSVITNTIFTVKNHTNEGRNLNISFHTIETNLSGHNWGCVHWDNKWAEIISLPNEEKWIPKVGDWCITTVHYNDEIWYKGRIWQIGKIDEDGFCIPIENGKFLSQSLSIGFRKALPHEIPNQSVQTTIYDFGEIHIPSITKKTKKLQTITIESTTDLNLGLTKIKSKQVQTIKI